MILEETKGFVTVSIDEWEELQHRIMWLDALEYAGVDNWDGVEEAIKTLNEWNKEENV